MKAHCFEGFPMRQHKEGKIERNKIQLHGSGRSVAQGTVVVVVGRAWGPRERGSDPGAE